MKKLNVLTIIILLFSLCTAEGFAEKWVGAKPNKNKEVKAVGAGCLPATAFKYLEFNNVRARVNNGGDMWWDFSMAKYEVPKGGGVSALYTGSIWIGGTDTNGQLRIAAHRFRSKGNDFYPGPLVAGRESPNVGNVTSEVCTHYDRIYYVDRNMVSEFLAYKQSESPTDEFPDYKIPEVITSWPGNFDYSIDGGDDAYDFYLAPFRDIDGDGVYNPQVGDYPYYIFDSKNYECTSIPTRESDSLNSEDMPLYGDATFWWVYNDRGNIHGETKGEAIGMEFRAQAFAFATNDELNNMTFYNYQIINRSSFSLKDTYFGVWTDADLGYAHDDYVGCDVQRGLGYLYNGDDDDDLAGPGYGKYPPAVGIDFFEGPYKDPSGIDDLSSYDANGVLNCSMGYADSNGDGEVDSAVNAPQTIFNGNINGLNFGDGIADNERWGMRRFLFHNNSSGDYGDPVGAIDYYRYLTGFWKNAKRMTYGGTGYSKGTEIAADFMFPGNTDPCNWGTSGVIPPDDIKNWTEASLGEENEPADRRFIQSAGPFTLQPGMVNYITTGAVWARSYEGSDMPSVSAVKKADDKAQALFEQCFQMIDGPDAPDMTFIPMDGKFIVHLSNSLISNNYLEQYVQEDYFISPVFEDRDYRFQGYQVFQLRHENVTLGQLYDVDFARVVFQCDLKDDIGDLVNFTYDEDIETNKGAVMVKASNLGLQHTFEITTDAFASGGSKNLVNNKKYYYLAIAYAHNEFKKYDGNDANSLDGQIKPYLPSRKSVSGELKVMEQIPHPRNMDNNGLVLNSAYGMQPSVTLVEGEGGAQIYTRLEDGIEEQILNGEDLSGKLVYKENLSPLDVRVVNPLKVKAGEYYVGFCADSVNNVENHFVKILVNGEQTLSNAYRYGHILDAKWFLATLDNGVFDTLYVSDTWISQKNEILFEDLGISIDIEQFGFAMSTISNGVADVFTEKNGYIGSNRFYDNEKEPWLDFVLDKEGADYRNWIRAGETVRAGAWNDEPGDPEGIFEGVLGGAWGPVRLTSSHTNGPRPLQIDVPFSENGGQFCYTPSVDIVFTKNRDLWTRVPVLEMADNTGSGASVSNPSSENNVLKFHLRGAPSLNKDGKSSVGTGISDKMEDANYLSDSGWSWFPGYAIDINSGKRLNMAFGEASDLVGYNGRDMLWNPVRDIVSSDGNYIFGGKHYVYVFAADELNPQNNNSFILPSYNHVDSLCQLLKSDWKKTMSFLSWVSIPVVRRGYEFVNYADMPDNDLRIEIRVGRPFGVGVSSTAVSNPINKNYPLYKFSLDSYVPQTNNKLMRESALESVNIVPNPYYGGNDYQLNPLDFTVKFINLPQKCDIKIFNMAGSLVRSYSKDNSSTIIEWDLKNNYQVPIAGGLYIIHINAPGVGEKTLKWFGVLRPDDLTSF